MTGRTVITNALRIRGFAGICVNQVNPVGWVQTVEANASYRANVNLKRKTANISALVQPSMAASVKRDQHETGRVVSLILVVNRDAAFSQNADYWV